MHLIERRRECSIRRNLKISLMGKITDVYFERTLSILKDRKINPVVDGYGIGTSISNAPVVDYAYGYNGGGRKAAG